MDEKPRRRWFRFSLRTLFVVVTVVGVWIGYNLNWIRERQAFLRKWGPNARVDSTWPVVSAPGQLWIFGEQGISRIILFTEESADKQTAYHLFPEAEIVSIWPRPQIAEGSLFIEDK